MFQMRESFDPASLSPVLWINAYRDGYVSTLDNNGFRQRGNIIDSATARTGQALMTDGALGTKPIYNGEGWYFEQGAKLSTGTTSSYNFLHNGGNYEIWCTFFLCPTNSSTYYRALLTTNGISESAKGILVRINSINGNNSLEVRAGNGTTSFVRLSGLNSVIPNNTNTFRLTKFGNAVKLYVNGMLVSSQSIGSSPAGDAAGIMNIMSNGSATANVYLKDLMIFDRTLTEEEVSLMNSRRFPAITPTPINVYIMAGDSNCAGRGLNSQIASDLNGTIRRAFMPTFSTALDYTSYFSKLQLGKNQTIPFENPASQHGAEMRFSKAMTSQGDIFIIKYGIGSVPLIQSPLGDWNTASSNSFYRKFTTSVIPQALNDLVHVYRRTPVFRGLIWTHGANDAVVGGTNVPWTRTGNVINVAEIAHGLQTGYKIPITESNSTQTVSPGIYVVTRIDNNNFTLTGVDAGPATGTLSYAAGATYKENLTSLINGTIDYLTGTIRNQISGGTGYTVNKLRIFIPETRSGATLYDLGSYSAVLAAQRSIGSSYLNENPIRIGTVLGTISQTTNDLSMQDALHYTTGGYDQLGQREANYFLQYFNE